MREREGERERKKKSKINKYMSKCEIIAIIIKQEFNDQKHTEWLERRRDTNTSDLIKSITCFTRKLLVVQFTKPHCMSSNRF